jgi:hypothetical protein
MADQTEVMKQVLTGLLDVLADTHPQIESTTEWKQINAISLNLLPFVASGQIDQVVDQLLLTLGGITPQRENMVEWAAIRAVCAEQRSSSGSTKSKLAALILQLDKTSPQRENIQEWNRIRAVCDGSLVQLAAD